MFLSVLMAYFWKKGLGVSIDLPLSKLYRMLHPFPLHTQTHKPFHKQDTVNTKIQKILPFSPFSSVS